MAFTKPVVNGSSGTWGTILNAALDDIQSQITANGDLITTNKNNITNLTNRVTTLESSSSSSAGKVTVATSGSRPALAIGQIVLETDTGFLYYGASVGGTATRVPWPGSVLAHIKCTSTQTFGSGSATGRVNFTTADLDRLGGWSSGNASRYTAQVPGWYQFSGGISFVTNATGYRRTTWWYNGGEINSSAVVVQAASGDSTAVPSRTRAIRMNAGDYVELGGMQNSGSSLTVDASTAYQPHMTVTYLGYVA